MTFCIDSEEAVKLNNFLISKSIPTFFVHNQMDMNMIEGKKIFTRETDNFYLYYIFFLISLEIKSEWDKCLPGMFPVIICTDDVALELNISNIEYLIHYTVTNISKTSFNRRFFVFMDNWIKVNYKIHIYIYIYLLTRKI